MRKARRWGLGGRRPGRAEEMLGVSLTVLGAAIAWGISELPTKVTYEATRTTR